MTTVYSSKLPEYFPYCRETQFSVQYCKSPKGDWYRRAYSGFYDPDWKFSPWEKMKNGQDPNISGLDVLEMAVKFPPKKR